jgi:hypothetical protein
VAIVAAKRRHHYLPVSYLSGFTPSGRQDDFLLALDLVTRDVRRARPRTVAYEKGLYAVNAPGVASDAFEDLLAEGEDARAARALRHVCSTRSLPDAELVALLGFASLLFVRSPRWRRDLGRWVRHRMGADLDQAVEEPGAWHWLPEYLDQAQVDLKYFDVVVRTLSGPALDGCQRSGLSPGDVMAGVSRHLTGTSAKSQFWSVAIMWPWRQMLAAELAKKSWSLCLADGAGTFICSDSPVGVAWPEDLAEDGEPRYADEGVLVTLPLDRNTALVAGLDGPTGVRRVPEAAVAQVNSQTARRAARFVFTPSPGSPVALSDGTITSAEALVQLIGEPGHGGNA